MSSIAIIRTVSEAKKLVSSIKNAGRTIGFVPTMGYFHRGHIALMTRCMKECDETVVSIFVNPIQFGPKEDLSKYPRDLERDLKMAGEAGVKYIFYPDAAEMYPDGFQTTVRAGALAEGFCGASRPGHFDGVCTVVAKLFNIITPDRAYFGMKDYQQLLVVEKMVEDLNMSVKIVRCETVREADGLAMSSRNSYLDANERSIAPALHENIEAAKKNLIKLSKDAGAHTKDIQTELEERKAELIKRGFKRVDYFKAADAVTLKEITEIDQLRACASIFIAGAAFIGNARLIDNTVFTVRN